jgi:hypothetical protein
MKTRILLAGLAIASALVVARPTLAQGPDPDFAHAVAARCKGESAYAIGACTCTVRNRLLAGWSEARVLDAYFAADVPPTEAEVTLATQMLIGCRTDLWFMFSTADRSTLGLETVTPVLTIVGATGAVHFYPRTALQ